MSEIAQGSNDPDAIVPFWRGPVTARVVSLDVFVENNLSYHFSFIEVTHEGQIECVGEDPLHSTKACLMIL